MKKILLCSVAFMMMLCCLTSCRPKAHNFSACDNLEYIEKFGFFYDIKLMFMTVFAVLKKDSSEKEKAAVK